MGGRVCVMCVCMCGGVVWCGGGGGKQTGCSTNHVLTFRLLDAITAKLS